MGVGWGPLEVGVAVAGWGVAVEVGDEVGSPVVEAVGDALAVGVAVSVGRRVGLEVGRGVRVAVARRVALGRCVAVALGCSVFVAESGTSVEVGVTVTLCAETTVALLVDVIEAVGKRSGWVVGDVFEGASAGGKCARVAATEVSNCASDPIPGAAVLNFPGTASASERSLIAMGGESRGKPPHNACREKPDPSTAGFASQ